MSEPWVLIPLKSLHGGKERLSGVLSESQRGELITAMLLDLVQSLLEVPVAADHILVVSEDEAARRVANLYGIGHFRPTSVASDPLNAQLAEAVASVVQRGGEEVLIVHADLPCARAADFRACLATHRETCTTARVTLVSDRAGTGTNCLLLSPPGAIALHFGADSRARHRAASGAASVEYRECSAGGLARDVDLPEDLDALQIECDDPQGTVGERTRDVVSGWGDGAAEQRR